MTKHPTIKKRNNTTNNSNYIKEKLKWTNVTTDDTDEDSITEQNMGKHVVAYINTDFMLKKFNKKLLVFAGLKNAGALYVFVEVMDKEGQISKLNIATPFYFPYMPQNLSLENDFRKTMGIVLYEIAKELFPVQLRHMQNTRGDKKYLTKDEKELKSYIYIRTKTITDVMLAKSYLLYLSYYGYTSDSFAQVQKTAFRNRISCRSFAEMRRNCTDKEFNYFISDMNKMNQGLCRNTLSRIGKNMSFNEYLALVKTAPKFIKECRYLILFNNGEIKFIEKHNMHPKTRLQYFFTKCIAAAFCRSSSIDIINDLIKFQTASIKVWRCFKNYNHYNGPYSISELKHLLQTIFDGYVIYQNNSNNLYDVSFVKIRGSPVKLLQKAIFNHRQEAVIRKKKILEAPDRPMVKPPVVLPEWIENLRLKTQRELLIAGEECNHCIGNFVNSNDIFVREGNVCAQIYRDNLTVGQCYDLNDKVTDASKDLSKRLNRSLLPVRENLLNAMRRSSENAGQTTLHPHQVTLFGEN